MALAVFSTSNTDNEIAHAIFKTFTAGELTPFREQLLDVIRTNAAELYDYNKEVDDDETD